MGENSFQELAKKLSDLSISEHDLIIEILKSVVSLVKKSKKKLGPKIVLKEEFKHKPINTYFIKSQENTAE